MHLLILSPSCDWNHTVPASFCLAERTCWPVSFSPLLFSLSKPELSDFFDGLRKVLWQQDYRCVTSWEHSKGAFIHPELSFLAT